MRFGSGPPPLDPWPPNVGPRQRWLLVIACRRPASEWPTHGQERLDAAAHGAPSFPRTSPPGAAPRGLRVTDALRDSTGEAFATIHERRDRGVHRATAPRSGDAICSNDSMRPRV